MFRSRDLKPWQLKQLMRSIERIKAYLNWLSSRSSKRFGPRDELSASASSAAKAMHVLWTTVLHLGPNEASKPRSESHKDEDDDWRGEI